MWGQPTEASRMPLWFLTWPTEVVLCHYQRVSVYVGGGGQLCWDWNWLTTLFCRKNWGIEVVLSCNK